MKKLNRKYAGFELQDGFVLEIFGSEFSAAYYISHMNIGIKELVFAVGASFDECVNEVENDLVNTDYTEEMNDYREKYMDG